jgi:DNA-binding CsgD family transcriptional regulator
MSLLWMNARARRLLGVRSPSGPCHRTIAAFDISGRPYCGPRCPLFEAACRQEIAPRTLRVIGPGGDRWIQLLIIPVTAPDGTGPYLVHCALDADEAHRIRDYVSRLASRTPLPQPGRHPGPTRILTLREREILARLARDETLWAIALDLSIAHPTVRNHVQHILNKLRVHSIAEAVALSLMEPGAEDGPEASSSAVNSRRSAGRDRRTSRLPAGVDPRRVRARA